MSSTAVAGSGATEWLAERLRCTAFPSPSAKVDAQSAQEWWMEVAGQPPEIATSKPRLGIEHLEATVGNGRLVLEMTIPRVEWLLLPMGIEEGENEGTLTVGPFSDTARLFVDMMDRWFTAKTCPPVQRLALGAVMWLPVKDMKEGYERIAKYVRNVTLDPESSTDFSYQINRPRKAQSGLPDLRINRLMKWSVATVFTKHFSITGDAWVVREQPSSIACRLELDINTALDYGKDIPPEDMARVFAELRSLGQEIAEEGDRP